MLQQGLSQICHRPTGLFPDRSRLEEPREKRVESSQRRERCQEMKMFFYGAASLLLLNPSDGVKIQNFRSSRSLGYSKPTTCCSTRFFRWLIRVVDVEIIFLFFLWQDKCCLWPFEVSLVLFSFPISIGEFAFGLAFSTSNQ